MTDFKSIIKDLLNKKRIKPDMTAALPGKGETPKARDPWQHLYNNEINAISWAPDIHKQREPSTRVNNYKYNPDTKELFITYTDGFRAKYKNIPKNLFISFHLSDSKGRFNNNHFKNLPYEEM